MTRCLSKLGSCLSISARRISDGLPSIKKRATCVKLLACACSASLKFSVMGMPVSLATSEAIALFAPYGHTITLGCLPVMRWITALFLMKSCLMRVR